MKTNLVIVGAGGHAKVALETAILEDKYKIVGLVDDLAVDESSILGFSVLPKLSQFKLASGLFFVAIGDNRTRKRRFEEMIELGWEPVTLIHPSAVISKFCSIGKGTIVCLRASICVEARVGDNTIINSAASVGHECLVGSHAHISVGVNMSGQSTVGEGGFMGTSSCIIPRVSVGEWSTVGAGAVVIRDVAAGTKVVGVPSREIG